MARETPEQVLQRYLTAEANGDTEVIRQLDMDIHWSVSLSQYEHVRLLREHLASRGLSPLDLLRRYYPEAAVCICGRPAYPFAVICQACYDERRV